MAAAMFGIKDSLVSQKEKKRTPQGVRFFLAIIKAFLPFTWSGSFCRTDLYILWADIRNVW